MSDNLILPGNPRYQPKDLRGIFGYDNNYVPVSEVELAAMTVLAEIGIIPKQDWGMLTQANVNDIKHIRTTAVDELEYRGSLGRKAVKHDIRSLVITIQEMLPMVLRRWVHVPLTSYDPLETARILQYLRAHRTVIRPKVKEVIEVFAGLLFKYSKTLQIGRTHGQHAIPITVGFWLATVLSRVIYNSQSIDQFASGLVGKITGAVGASNAVMGLGIDQKCGDWSFQDRVLFKLGLQPAQISTQILPPEPLAYFLFSNLMLSASFGQLGRDCRHLMRSEIAEVGEPFSAGQVGSSTMAQKRNPLTFENIEAMWLRSKSEFGKVLDSMISEHQRDLVGSPLARDFPIILVNLVVQLDTLLRKGDNDDRAFLARLTINEDNCRRNFQMNADLVLAEPIYIALQMAGYQQDAHELVNRQAMPISQERRQSLMASVETLAESQPLLAEALANIPSEVRSLLNRPDSYIGDASAKAIQTAELAETYAASLGIDPK